MKTPGRFALWFVIGIVALIGITVGVVLVTRSAVPALPQDSPQGTVQRFLTAIQNRDFPTAYGYLSPNQTLGPKGLPGSTPTLTYDEWVRSMPPSYQTSSPAWRATLGKTTVNGDQATVEVVVDTFRPGGPFENAVRSQTVLFQLARSDNRWLIISPPYLYWLF